MPILTLDGISIGRVTDFQADLVVRGPMHLLDVLKPCDVTPSKGIFEISASLVSTTACDPLANQPVAKKSNRGQRRRK